MAAVLMTRTVNCNGGRSMKGAELDLYLSDHLIVIQKGKDGTTEHEGGKK